MTFATGIRTVLFFNYSGLFAARRDEFTAIFIDVCERGPSSSSGILPNSSRMWRRSWGFVRCSE